MTAAEAILPITIDILSSTVSCLAGNIYDNVVNKLKHGDLVDERLRNIFVRRLTDINTKLDSLSLVQLDVSRISLQEGLKILNLALRSGENNPNEAARVLNEERIASAKDSFKQSRKAATTVFLNFGLNIKHRIVACMLQVAARILETGLKDPVAATHACNVPLHILHGLPAVREIFSVFLNGGFKSHFDKADRFEIVMTVLSINHAIFSLASKNIETYPMLFSWPEIKLKNDSTFNLIKDGHKILGKISRSYKLVKQINQVIPVWRLFTSQRSFSLNSRGEVVVVTDDKITVIYSTGDTKDVAFPNPTEDNLVELKVCSFAVDGEDSVYVVRCHEIGDENGSGRKDFVMYTFDKDYNINHKVLEFLDAQEYQNVNIAIHENQNLMMITNGEKIYVCDKRGSMKVKFKQDQRWLLMNASISRNNEIMTVSDNRRVVEIYSSDGEKNLTKTLAEGHQAVQVAFHFGTCEAAVLVYEEERKLYFCYHYSETRAFEARVRWYGTCRLPCLPLEDPEKYWWKENVQSLPSTAIPVAVGQNITFI